jgi:2-polyprenyl-3-methyl-5-hydroxy-6-metoxy-1,4-benzoquinol methylase
MTEKKQWYEDLFENYAEHYDRESFTQGTTGEVDFIELEINHDKKKYILDIGCGTGRHAIELARRGYRVVGVDLSASQLAQASKKAKALGVSVDFLQKDARFLDFSNEFDLVIMICEGAFSLMETDEMNFEILRNAKKALKVNGKLVFTTLNALYPLYHSVKEFINSDPNGMKIDSLDFDLMTFREKSTMQIIDDNGTQKTLHSNERYFAPSEITWYLKSLGFKEIDIHGCKLGHFSRTDQLTPDDYEMLVIADMYERT